MPVMSRGKIVACQFVIQVTRQRHLDDLMAKVSRFCYRFDMTAERAAKFIQLLPHTSKRAFKRMPITLEPWQLFL